MTIATEYYPELGVQAADDKIDELATADHGKVDADATSARQAAKDFAGALADGRNPVSAVQGLPVRERYVSFALARVLGDWEMHRVESGNRPAPNPMAAWGAYHRGSLSWLVAEELIDHLGEWVTYSDLRAKFGRDMTPSTMLDIGHDLEKASTKLVVRKKPGTPVSWLVRLRTDADPETPGSRYQWEAVMVE